MTHLSDDSLIRVMHWLYSTGHRFPRQRAVMRVLRATRVEPYGTWLARLNPDARAVMVAELERRGQSKAVRQMHSRIRRIHARKPQSPRPEMYVLGMRELWEEGKGAA